MGRNAFKGTALRERNDSRKPGRRNDFRAFVVPVSEQRAAKLDTTFDRLLVSVRHRGFIRSSERACLKIGASIVKF